MPARRAKKGLSHAHQALNAKRRELARVRTKLERAKQANATADTKKRSLIAASDACDAVLAMATELEERLKSFEDQKARLEALQRDYTDVLRALRQYQVPTVMVYGRREYREHIWGAHED